MTIFKDSSSKGLKARIKKARDARKVKKPRGLREATSYGKATRLVAELVSGLLLGAGLGYGLDKWLGTTPWMLIVFFMLGTAAGILNVMRAAKDLTADLEQYSQTLEKDDNIDDDLYEDEDYK